MPTAAFPTPLPTKAEGEKVVRASSRRLPSIEPGDAPALDAMAQRLEEIADNMGLWAPGSGLIHRVNNTRTLLFGEAHRLRRMAERQRVAK